MRRWIGEVLLIGWPFLLPVVAFSVFGWPSFGYTPLPFSPEGWSEARPEERGYILDDLRRKHSLIGLTEDAVVALLGPPEDRGEKVWQYRVGYRGYDANGILAFPFTLQVEFDLNRHVSRMAIED